MIKKLINLGVNKNLSTAENKLIRLLNIFCLTWYLMLIIFVIVAYFFEEQFLFVTLGHLFQFTFMTIVQLFQKKKKYLLARSIFISISFIQMFTFCNFILPGELLEFYYILIPLFSLLFLKKWTYHIFFLLLIIISYLIPVYFYHTYDTSSYNIYNIPNMFLVIFLLFYYFKNINERTEKLLEQQKNNALHATEIIAIQKKELEQLHEVQNNFFINVAHEIRTPLTILSGNSKMLYSAIPNPTEDQKEEIEEIEKQQSKIQNIINDVIDLSRMDRSDFELKKEPVLLDEIIQKAISSHELPFNEKSIELLFNFDDRQYIVNGSSIYLERVINNLFSNAYKYAPLNSTVDIELTEKNDNYFITISDNGTGIPETDLQKIFDRFYQSNHKVNASGGNGVGLAFCKEIIEQHNGKISASNKPNGGACLTIILPKMQSSNDDQLKTAIAQHKVEHAKILIVEDSMDMKKYLNKILKNYTLSNVSNGKEALELLKTDKFDLILTDYMMPEINGFELITTLKNNNNTTPIIMLTARQSNQTKIDVLNLGIDDFITKPFDFQELTARINNSLKNNLLRSTFNSTNKVINDDKIDTSILSEIKAYILKNTTSVSFNKADLCEHFALSNSSLYRKIKSSSGLSPKEFINEVKLKEAERILNEYPNIGLKKLALQLGYVNYAYFGKLYKKRFGKDI